MARQSRPRVLYSVPHKIGAARISGIAWHEAVEAAQAGAEMLVYPRAIQRPLPSGIQVNPTLARGRLRIPYRTLGRMRAHQLHDAIVARRLRHIASQIDVVHVWPLAARRTLMEASKLGIPSVLERPNTHTRFAYTVVRAECERLGVELPPDHEHAYQADILRREEEEFLAADYLLCPSDFVARTFVDEGYAPDRLLAIRYGFDPERFHPGPETADQDRGLRVLFAGVAAVRKGLHFALEAWKRSPASSNGTFLIAGEFLTDYREKLGPLLDQPGIEVIGHRSDVPELMRASDILVLPSLEEGSALVCSEAMGSGCVPLVSDFASAFCRHMENSLVHSVGDVEALTQHLTLLDRDRVLLARLRSGAISTSKEATWAKAGEILVDAYREAIDRGPVSRTQDAVAPAAALDGGGSEGAPTRT